jgi:glycosyltransferase involved in cell wall biosynthesis
MLCGLVSKPARSSRVPKTIRAMDLSVIVPLYNEEENVAPLYSAIVDALADFDGEFELLFVDDGSSDSTFARARDLALSDRRLSIVKFRDNFGQTPAMAAGIDLAKGRILVTMDGDLQNDPSDIPRLLAKIDEGYDIVVGWRHDRQDKLVSRKLPSRVANWLIGKVTRVPIRDNGCSLKAYRASVIKGIPLYSEMHRFIPAMASMAGARIAELKVRHHPRRFGQSKYGLSRIYKVLLDILVIKTLVSFSGRPLVWFSILASPFALLSAWCFVVAFRGLINEGNISIPIAGSGVLFAVIPIVLVLGGALAEIVHSVGDLKNQDLARLTLGMSRHES